MRRSASLLKSMVRAPHLVIAALAISLTPAPAYADFDCQIAKLLAGDGAEVSGRAARRQHHSR